jgi:catechol 2,3-dioxygenase-like lactoylglutathione lyase family enzyme
MNFPPKAPANGANVHMTVPLFNVTDMAAAREFYIGGLGFRQKLAWTPDDSNAMRWCWLELEGVAVMLQQFWREDGPDSAKPDLAKNGGWEEGQPLGAGMTICFICKDALAVRREALSRGLAPSQAPFVGNGLWVVSYTDPDGYRLDFESPTDVEEGTEFDAGVHGLGR